MSPFLRVPAELRNRIYDFVFGVPQSVMISFTPYKYRYEAVGNSRRRGNISGGYSQRSCCLGEEHHDTNMALLRSCKQIYGETASLPYALHTFVFRDENLMKKCMRKLTRTQKDAIGVMIAQYRGGSSSCIQSLFACHQWQYHGKSLVRTGSLSKLESFDEKAYREVRLLLMAG